VGNIAFLQHMLLLQTGAGTPEALTVEFFYWYRLLLLDYMYYSS